MFLNQSFFPDSILHSDIKEEIIPNSQNFFRNDSLEIDDKSYPSKKNDDENFEYGIVKFSVDYFDLNKDDY